MNQTNPTKPRNPVRLTDQDLGQQILGALRKINTLAENTGGLVGGQQNYTPQLIAIADAIDANTAALTTCLASVDAAIAAKIDIADALQMFSFGAYETLEAPPDSSFPNLGGTYQKIDVLTAPGSITGRGITVDRPNSTFAFDYDGVYRLSISGSMEHNSSNQGRTFMIRLYDETDADYVGEGMVIGTGRNAEATTLAATLLIEVLDEDKNHVFSLHIGNGSTYTAVSFQVLGVDINAVSEWREPLPSE